MARLARLVIPHLSHHITQRGASALYPPHQLSGELARVLKGRSGGRYSRGTKGIGAHGATFGGCGFYQRSARPHRAQTGKKESRENTKTEKIGIMSPDFCRRRGGP